MNKILLVLFLASSLIYAGLPPTTSKLSSDSSDFTTFKFRFPNFTGTRTGTVTSLGVNSIAGGGTGQSTQSAAANAILPAATATMDTIVYNGSAWIKIAESNTYRVGPGRQYTTISAALTAIGAATTAAEVRSPKLVLIAGGVYDESLTIPDGRFITLQAEGLVILGSGDLANFGSTTARSITWTPSATGEFGAGLPSVLNINGVRNIDPTSSLIALGGVFRISGNLNVTEISAPEGKSKQITLSSVKIDGQVSDTTTALTNWQLDRVYVIGTFTSAAGILERVSTSEFDALITALGYNSFVNSDIGAGFTVTANQDTLPPSGIFGSTLTGTFTSPASGIKLDPVSDYFFTLNGATLGGSASKVLLSGNIGGNASTVTTNANLTGHVTSTGNAAVLGSFSSANLLTAVTNETGTGIAVFNDTPTLIAPLLGTPTSGVLTNTTGLPISTGVSGLGSNVATFLGTASSANLRSAVSDESGTGALLFADGAIGNATATTLNKLTLTAPATGSTFTLLDGKTFTVNKSLTLEGTDGTTQTFPTTSATIARTDAAQTFTGVQTFSTAIIPTSGGTGQSSFTLGDILYSDATNNLAKLPIGTNTKNLKVVAGQIAYAEDDLENFALNYNFEGGNSSGTATSWVSSASTGSASTYTITTSTSEVIKGLQSQKIVLNGDATSDLDYRQTATVASGMLRQWVVGIAYSSTAATTQICSIVDGGEQTCVPSASLILDGVPHTIEIPTTITGANSTIGIKVKTLNSTGSIILDQAYFKQGLPNQNLSLDHTYSAVISSAGVKSSENKSGWLAAGPFTPTSTSTYAITFATGLFSVAPNCTYENAGASFNAVFLTSAISATGVTVIVHDSQTGSNVAIAFTINCQRAGNDYLAASSAVYNASNTSYDWTNYGVFTADTTLYGQGTMTGNANGYPCKHRRNGGDLEMQCDFTGGTVAATLGAIVLPVVNGSQLNVDTTKILRSNTTANDGVSIGHWRTGGANTLGNIVTATGTATDRVYVSASYNNAAMLKPALISSYVANTQAWSIWFKVPISGWSNLSQISALLASYQAEANKPVARAYASATSMSGSLATVSWTTEEYDSHAALASGTFTCPVAGKYQVNSGLAMSGTFILNSTITMQIQKNGTAVSEDVRYAGGAMTQMDVAVSDIVSCAVGDTIRVQAANSGTSPVIVTSNSRNYLSIAWIGL